MSDAKHTPGPWTSRLLNPKAKKVFEFDIWEQGVSAGGPIARVMWNSVITRDTDANAKLIAAAPALADALEALLKPLGPDGYVLPAGAVATDAARAALRAAGRL